MDTLKFRKSDPKLAKIAKNAPDSEFFALINQTIGPICTNDSSMKLLGPGRCHGHIEILKIRPEIGEKSPRR